MKFNINNYVWVKLTPKGEKTLRVSRLVDMELTGLDECAIKPPPEKNGYTQFQLWDLMRLFGESMFNGCELSFETEILIGEEPGDG